MTTRKRTDGERALLAAVDACLGVVPVKRLDAPLGGHYGCLYCGGAARDGRLHHLLDCPWLALKRARKERP